MNAIQAIDEYVDLLLSAAPADPIPAAPPAPLVAPLPQVLAVPAAAAPRATPPPGAAAASQQPPREGSREKHLSRWLRLRCGGQTYALELLKIREVMLPTPLVPLRGVGQAVSGIMNLRGQVVPVLDLAMHFGGDRLATTPDTRIVVLSDRSEVLGLRVSAVEDIVLIDAADIEDPRVSQLAPVGDQRIHGIARPAGRVMLLLDALHLLAMPLHR